MLCSEVGGQQSPETEQAGAGKGCWYLCCAVWIPPQSAGKIDVNGSACGTNDVVELLSTPLKGGLQVTITLADAFNPLTGNRTYL